jgi:hypothetical protein
MQILGRRIWIERLKPPHRRILALFMHYSRAPQTTVS